MPGFSWHCPPSDVTRPDIIIYTEMGHPIADSLNEWEISCPPYSSVTSHAVAIGLTRYGPRGYPRQQI